MANPNNPKPLNAQQRAFVDFLLADPKRNATEAYMRVYASSSKDAAGASAARLLLNPLVRALIDQKDDEIANGSKLTRELLAEHLRQLVTADPRGLMEFYRGACRFCHGHLHRYQFTPAELERALDSYKANNAAAVIKRLPGAEPDPMCLKFDYRGGVGFNPHNAPHPACPECFGHGEGYSYVKDTRSLTPEQARLYAGLKVTKEGLEIKTRSQDKMLELAMRANGMLTERAQEGDDGEAPPVAVSYVEEDASDPAQEHLRNGGQS
jgi:phage terminase small subunit